MKEKIESFENLKVWKECISLTVGIYNYLKKCRDYGLRDQLQRSAVSIPSNIAEVFERKSNKEFIQFLCISRGFCAELRTQLYVHQELDLVDKVNVQKFLEKSRKILAMLSKLIVMRKTLFDKHKWLPDSRFQSPSLRQAGSFRSRDSSFS